MKQAIELTVMGLKCDNPTCNYRDDTVKFEDYPILVNKPCPDCGSNLLTQADLDTCLKMRETADLMNRLFGDQPEENQTIRFKIDMDGSGIPKSIEKVKVQ